MVEGVIHIAFWTGAISALFLIVLLLLAIVGGELNIGVDTDVDNGFGVFKSILTFLAMSCLTLYALYTTTSLSDVILLTIAITTGILAILLLSYFLRWLLSKQEEGNWYMHESLNEVGDVYLGIPEFGFGKVHVKIQGIERELKAKSANHEQIKTHSKVIITAVEDDYVIVIPYK